MNASRFWDRAVVIFQRRTNWWDIDQALCMCVWGSWVLLGDYFGSAKLAGAYAALGANAPHWAWGVLILVTGMFRAWASAFGDSNMRSAIRLISAGVWLAVAILYWTISPFVPSLPLYAWLSYASFNSYCASLRVQSV